MRSHALLALLGLLASISAGCEDEVRLTIPTATEVHFQNPPTEVDILLVIDNSCSMQDEQVKLSEGFDAFVEFFDVADIDYQIGIVTTDVEDPNHSGQLVNTGGERIIRRSTDNAADVFRQNVQVGVQGAPFERGLDAAGLAFSDELLNSSNAGFLREEALLSIIFVSDEEDGSFQPVNTMVNLFRGLKSQTSRDAFNASALVGLDLETGLPGDCLQDPDQPTVGAGASERYYDVAIQSGGVAASICEDDFADVVGRMGLASSRLKDTFPLNRAPDHPDELDVEIFLPDDPETALPLPPEGLDDEGLYSWVYEEDLEEDIYQIRFTDLTRLPPINTRIVIRYEL